MKRATRCSESLSVCSEEIEVLGGTATHSISLKINTAIQNSNLLSCHTPFTYSTFILYPPLGIETSTCFIVLELLLKEPYHCSSTQAITWNTSNSHEKLSLSFQCHCQRLFCILMNIPGHMTSIQKVQLCSRREKKMLTQRRIAPFSKCY